MLKLKTCTTVAILTACTSVAGVWHTYHGDYGLTGVSEQSFEKKPARVWRKKVGKELPSAVVGGHGRLFCIADDTTIVALTTDGAELWTKRITGTKLTADGKPRDETFSAPPLYINEDLLIAAANSGRIFAISPAAGKIIWKTEIGSRVRGAPNYSAGSKDGPGLVFVIATESGTVYALSAADGSTIWKSEPLDRTDGHPAVDDNYIALGNCTASFITLFTSDGKTAGSVEVGEECEMAGGVALHAGQVFGGNRRGSVAAADIEKGSITWRHEKGQGELFTTPAVTNKRVVFYGTDGAVYCVERESGKEVWTAKLEGRDPVSPIIADSTVIAGVDGTLFALKLKDGKQIWRIDIGDEFTEPAVVDGKLIVGVDDGHVSAYEEDGK